MSDVAQWLGELGLGQYAAAFHDNDIEFELLPRLTDEQLKELGVSSMGHRMKILAAIEKSSGQPGTSLAGREPFDDAKEPTIARWVDAERRQLTVMFCDLVGSTALSTKLDPEDLRELITSFQDRCRQAIKQYQGFIARYMGDGMLVYFGYPQAHEDDAERAVRAGLAIMRSMAELNAEVGRRHEVVLAVRVGVATGLVVVGDIVGEGAAEEAAVVGETPNLAARLQGMAEPNQVVVASVTRQLLQALFEYEDLGTHELKGIAQPVQVWRVVREGDIDSPYEAKRVGGRLPLVGRQEELGLLVRSWEAAKERRGQVVLIQGEAGIGKSRLLEALREHVPEEDYVWVAARCSPFHTNSALYPVIEHMKRVMSWKPEDDVEARLEKLEGALRTQSLPLEEVVPLYAELMSLPLPEERYPALQMTPQQKREATFDAVVGWLLELAERKPVLHVYEDLHWADPTTLELLGLYIEQSPTVSMLNVLTYRPEFVPPWSMRSHMTPITLNRLERTEVEAIVGNLAGGKSVPADVLEHIASKADGVPLYVEELTKAILGSEVLEEQADRYVLNGSLADMRIPSTLQDSLMARLDRVPLLREMAQIGAVLGREFPYEMLQALASREDSILQDGLGQLVENELLYQRGRGRRACYVFKHALIQDAAYHSLLRSARQQYHRQVAELLEARFPETVETHRELLAHHFTEAGLTERAIGYWQRGGEQALQRSATLEGIGHLTKALELLSALPETLERIQQELDIQLLLGPAAIASKGYGAPEVARTYKRARALCEQIGDTPQLFPTLRGLWNSYFLCGHYQAARERGEELLGLAESLADPALLVEAHRALGSVLYFLGESPTALTHLEQGIAFYNAEQHRGLAFLYGADPGLVCRLYAALTVWLRGSPQQARMRMDEALTMVQVLSHAHTQAFALAYAATLHQFRREVQAAHEQAESAVAVATEHGFAQWAAYGTVLAGWALAAQGQRAEGVAQMRQGLEDMRATGAEVFRPYFLTLLAETYAEGKQVDEGLRVAAEASDTLETVEANEQGFCTPELYRLKGELLLMQSTDHHVQAEACFQRSLDVARRHEAKSLELRAAMSLGRLWRQQGKQAGAHKLLAEVYGWFDEGFDTADLKDAKTLLEELT